jgi:3-hydroxyacyl-CoA dehydrogenase/enoyl-CoA hydratase/3-hydroxybutyryl-CoA epimerase
VEDYVKAQEQKKLETFTTEAKIEALLQKIQPSDSDTDLANCDLIIEAVFENESFKTNYY